MNVITVHIVVIWLSDNMFHLLNNCTIHSPSSVTTILCTVVVEALIEIFHHMS